MCMCLTGSTISAKYRTISQEHRAMCPGCTWQFSCPRPPWSGREVKGLGFCRARLQGSLLGTSLNVLHSGMILKWIQDHKEHYWLSACCCLEYGAAPGVPEELEGTSGGFLLPQSTQEWCHLIFPMHCRIISQACTQMSVLNFDFGSVENLKMT